MRCFAGGALVPYYGLLGLWICLGSPPVLLGALAFWGFLTVFSSRLSPWLVLVGLSGLFLAGPGDTLFTGALFIGASWCLSLALVAALTGIRLTLTVRRWRGQSAGPLTVSAGLLAGTGTFAKARNKIFSPGGTLLVVAIIKLGIALTSVTTIDPRNLVRTLDLEAASVMVPLLGLEFWLLASTVRWGLERIAGDVVLEVPVDPRIGPVAFARATNAVELADVGLGGCRCEKKARAKGGKLHPPWHCGRGQRALGVGQECQDAAGTGAQTPVHRGTVRLGQHAHGSADTSPGQGP